MAYSTLDRGCERGTIERESVVMKRSDIEKLTDELIGQAVLLLLKRKTPVNSMALLTELRSLQAIETDASRCRVYTSVIADIEAVLMDKNQETKQQITRGQMEVVQSLSGKSASLNSGKGKVH